MRKLTKRSVQLYEGPDNSWHLPENNSCANKSHGSALVSLVYGQEEQTGQSRWIFCSGSDDSWHTPSTLLIIKKVSCCIFVLRWTNSLAMYTEKFGVHFLRFSIIWLYVHKQISWAINHTSSKAACIQWIPVKGILLRETSGGCWSQLTSQLGYLSRAWSGGKSRDRRTDRDRKSVPGGLLVSTRKALSSLHSRLTHKLKG